VVIVESQGTLSWNHVGYRFSSSLRPFLVKEKKKRKKKREKEQEITK
jgi:hypothetical protein